MFSSAFYPLALQRSARIKSLAASNGSSSTAPRWGRRRVVGPETPFYSHTRSPHPSTAREGEKDLSARSTTAPRSIPSQDLMLLPKDWASHIPPAAGGGAGGGGDTAARGLKPAACLPVTTRSSGVRDTCREGNRENDSYCDTQSVGGGPRLLIFLWHRRACLCRQTALQPGGTALPAGFLSSRTSRLHPPSQPPKCGDTPPVLKASLR